MAKDLRINLRVNHHVKDAMQVIASYTPGDLSDHIRFATKKYIESEIAALELRISAAQVAGLGDVEAQRRLAELRAAYEETTQ